MTGCGKVRDVLVPLGEYPHLRVDASLRDAFMLMQEGRAQARQYRHLLVIDERDLLVGVLGIRDLLRALFPDYLKATLPGRYEGSLPPYPALSTLWEDSFAAECAAHADKPVGPHLAPVPATVVLDDPLTKAAYLMVVAGENMLPVVEGDRLVGAVRIVDVFARTAEVLLHG
jgi:CBS domain-containing protein